MLNRGSKFRSTCTKKKVKGKEQDYLFLHRKEIGFVFIMSLDPLVQRKKLNGRERTIFSFSFLRRKEIGFVFIICRFNFTTDPIGIRFAFIMQVQIYNPQAPKQKATGSQVQTYIQEKINKGRPIFFSLTAIMFKKYTLHNRIISTILNGGLIQLNLYSFFPFLGGGLDI